MSLTPNDTRHPTVTISWLASDSGSEQIELTEESHPQQLSRVSGFDVDLDFSADSLEEISAKRHLVEYLHAINRDDRNE